MKVRSVNLPKRAREMRDASDESYCDFDEAVRLRGQFISFLSVYQSSSSPSPPLPLALPLGELIHFDGVEWPCKCWTRRKRRRCKLVASDQISRVCLCCSLPLSLAASSPSLPPQCPKRIMATVKGNPLAGGAAKCVAGQTDTAATQRGRERQRQRGVR